MKKILTAAVLLSVSLVPASLMAAPEAFVNNVHYKATPTQLIMGNDDSKIEVIEFFSYSCPHCFKLDPQIQKWKETLPENVAFIHVPAIFRESWVKLAQLFYAAEVTGDIERLHPLIFKAIHVKKRKIQTDKQILDFVEEHGVDRNTFAEAMESRVVVAKVKKALILSQKSGITGVPSMIVGGQYRTNAPLAGGMDKMLKAVDFLIQKESNK